MTQEEFAKCTVRARLLNRGAARSEGFLFATTWQPAVFVNFLTGSNAVLKILERFLDAAPPPEERDNVFESQKGESS